MGGEGLKTHLGGSTAESPFWNVRLALTAQSLSKDPDILEVATRPGCLCKLPSDMLCTRYGGKVVLVQQAKTQILATKECAGMQGASNRKESTSEENNRLNPKAGSIKPKIAREG